MMINAKNWKKAASNKTEKKKKYVSSQIGYFRQERINYTYLSDVLPFSTQN